MTQSQKSTDSSVESGLQRHGKLSYMEIPATDTARAAAFYANVFGWTIRGDDRHRSFTDASGELIGAFEPGNSISREAGVLPYVYVQGLDATLEKVQANGGEVVKPAYPEGALWVATFRDCEGNLMGVWQAGGR